MDKNRLLLYMTVFLIMGLSNSVIPVLPEIAALWQGNGGVLASSLLFSGYFIGALLTMLPFGMLSDRYEKRSLILIAITLTLVSGVVLLTSGNLYMLVLARLIEGVACGAFFPVAYALLSEYPQRNRYIGEFNFLLNAGLAAGVALAGYLAEWHIRGGVLVFTLMAVLVLAAGISALRRGDAGPGMTQTKSKKVRVDRREDKLPSPGTIAGHFADRDFYRIWVISFLLFGISGVLTAFYPEYSQDMLSKTALGLSIAAMYVSAMAANIVVGRMDIQYNILIRGGVMIAVCGALLAIAYPLPGFALIGAGSGAAMIGLPVAVAHMRIPRGLAMGIFNTYTYAGMGLMPVIAGILLLFSGFEFVFAVCAIVLLLSLSLRDRLESES